MQERLKLATYNIHRCIGADGFVLPERILSVLHEMNADVIALQEVELHHEPSQNLLAYLARHTGLTPIAGPTITHAESGYGNAMLTRLPILAVRRIDLSLPDRDPRGAIDMRLDWQGHQLHLIATHLGLNPGERRHQVRRLLKLLDVSSDNLTILMDDINEWFLWGRPLRWLNRVFPVSQRRRTFPARWPLFALDRIWVYPPAVLTGITTHNSKLARVTSDHLPLQAVLEMA
jgi:endonuclease/exonuclease/phosphatase family metal-dependent hydrolase